jgi:hypothetical protein
VLAAACEEAPRAIDPFPVRFDPTIPQVMLGADVGAGPSPAVVDTLAALTLVDPVAAGVAAGPPSRRLVELTLLGLDPAGQPTIPRARFPSTAALLLHSCDGDDLCPIGLADQAIRVGAVIGADVLGRSAVRFDFPAGELRFFPELSGTEAELTSDCHAVMAGVFAGGGTLLIAGTEVPFSGRRPVIGACLDQADADEREQRGTDTLLAVSTGTAVSILAASAYDRYAAQSGAPDRTQLPDSTLHLPSGPVAVQLASIGRMALLGRLSEKGSERGPCRELYLNRRLSTGSCESEAPPCPCPDGELFCRAAAGIDLAGPLPVAILPDDHPLLQSLRDELRPSYPELDGVIGAAALAPLRLGLDYPNGRLVMRCLDASSCTTRPAVRSRASIPALERCRTSEVNSVPDAGPIEPPDAGPVDAGPPDAAPPDGG